MVRRPLLQLMSFYMQEDESLDLYVSGSWSLICTLQVRCSITNYSQSKGPNSFVLGLASVTITGRVCFALIRDGLVPFSKYFRKVDKFTRAPIR